MTMETEGSREDSPEVVAEAMIAYAAQNLEFTETDDMQNLREKIRAADDPEEQRKLIGDYQDKTRAAAGTSPRSQIGQNVADAALFRRLGTGGMFYYPESLDQAIRYAWNLGYDDVVRELEAFQTRQNMFRTPED